MKSSPMELRIVELEETQLNDHLTVPEQYELMILQKIQLNTDDYADMVNMMIGLGRVQGVLGEDLIHHSLETFEFIDKGVTHTDDTH